METKTVENLVKHQDELTPESLENCIKQLEGNVQDLHTQVDMINNDIATKKRALEDLNKPELTQKQLDIITDAIGNFTDNLRFSDNDFEIELTLGYDRKIEIDHLDFTSSCDMENDIMRHIEKQFKIVEEKSSIDEQVKENLGL